MKTEPIVINLNIRVDVDNPQQLERLMKAMSEPVEAEQDAEQDAEQWVELDAPGCEKPYIRVSVDGERVQERSQEGRWNDYDAWWIKQAYRKGREVAEAENAALREQVRAVEWVVRTAQDVDRAAVHSEKPYYDLVHAYAIESLHAALAEFSNPEVRP